MGLAPTATHNVRAWVSNMYKYTGEVHFVLLPNFSYIYEWPKSKFTVYEVQVFVL
jgi:hypothetical protein